MSTVATSSPRGLADMRGQLARWWSELALRERALVGVGGLALAVLVVWLVAVQPALRTLRIAPTELAVIDLQMQEMQLAAVESDTLRSASPVPATQAAEALRAATQRLGDKAKLVVQGDRATLSFTGIPFDALRGWLVEARSGARARPVEAQWLKAATGYSGSIIVALSGAT